MNAAYSPFASTPGANNDFISSIKDLAGDFLTGLGQGLGAGAATNSSPDNRPMPTYNGNPGQPTTGQPNPTGVQDFMTSYGPMLLVGGVVLVLVLAMK